MKIAFFTDTFLPKIDGVVFSTITISSALAAKGNEIVIFAPRPARGKIVNWSPSGIKLELLNSIPTLLYPDFRAAMPISPKILRSLRRINPDIIHFQTTFLLGGGGVILGKILKKPIIGSFHGYFMEPEYLKIVSLNAYTKIVSKLLWKYAAFFFNQCDAVLTYSEGAKKDLEQHRIKKPIFVISNSIDEVKIKKVGREQISELRQRYNLSKKVVLYVGRVSPEKSLDTLVKSFSYVLKKVPDATLLLIGDGPIKKDIMRLCSSLKIGKHVVFTGQIPQEKLLQEGYYQVADVFATASTSELQPISIIEAMYFGLPLVGVAKRGIFEMLQGVGLLSQPDDIERLAQNIVKVISDKRVYDRLSKNSQQEYERKYKLKKVIKAYDGFYKEVLERYKQKQSKKS